MPRRILPCCIALLLTLLLGVALFSPAPSQAPLVKQTSRQLLRIWSVSSVGGSDSWLKKQLRQFEKQNPGVMTYLRQVTLDAVTEPDAVLPDLILYTPGTLSSPAEHFAALTPPDQVVSSLLQCGCWQDQQLALPLCWGGYVLAVDSRFDATPAATPAPTSLLGQSYATPDPDAAPHPYPYDAILAADTPLLTASGSATLILCDMLDPSLRPPLTDSILTQNEVYARFRSRHCASALLTSGQFTAFQALTAAGKGFSYSVIVPERIITDQVLLGSIVRGAEDSAAPQLLSFLISRNAQQALTSQELHTVRTDLKLYASGVPAQLESAARHSLSALNAFVSYEDIEAASHLVSCGQSTTDQFLPQLTASAYFPN